MTKEKNLQEANDLKQNLLEELKKTERLYECLELQISLIENMIQADTSADDYLETFYASKRLVAKQINDYSKINWYFELEDIGQ